MRERVDTDESDSIEERIRERVWKAMNQIQLKK